MKYTLMREQRRTFARAAAVEFEQLLSQEVRQHLAQEIEAVVSERRKRALPALPSQECRDLSRESVSIRKALYATALAEIARELAGPRVLRFAYDQLYVSPTDPLPARGNTRYTLAEASCVSRLAGAFLFCLEGEYNGLREEGDLFPCKAGNATFFSPHVPWHAQAYMMRPQQKFLLLAYAEDRSQYILQPRDVHTHALKRLGYVFGDRLSEKWHPTLVR